jgi:DNA-binding beta-propeller fold protein YncE
MRNLATYAVLLIVSSSIGCGGGGASSGGGGSGAGASAFDLACTTDSLSALPASGFVDLGPAGGFVPLCGGAVLIGDRTLNRVLLVDVRSGAVAESWQLNAAPGDMASDPADDAVFVGLDSSNEIAKIALKSGALSYTALTSPVLHVAASDRGLVFATVGSGYNVDGVAVIDGATGTLRVTARQPGFYALAAFNSARSELITAEEGLSPSTVRRCAFDPATFQFTLIQDGGGGFNGEDLAVSPDGAHVAFPCGGGNGNGYQIADFEAQDITASTGAWNTGAYPTSAAFSPDGAVLAASNGGDLDIFDVATHALSQQYGPFTGCGATNLLKVRISRGGRIAYGYASCGSGGRLFWRVFR